MSIEILNLCDLLQKERDKHARIRAKVEALFTEAAKEEKNSFDRWGPDSIAGWSYEILGNAYKKILTFLDGDDSETAHACGYNCGKVDERDRIRAKVVALRDDAKKVRENPTKFTRPKEAASGAMNALQQVLDLLDGAT